MNCCCCWIFGFEGFFTIVWSVSPAPIHNLIVTSSPSRTRPKFINTFMSYSNVRKQTMMFTFRICMMKELHVLETNTHEHHFSTWSPSHHVSSWSSAPNSTLTSSVIKFRVKYKKNEKNRRIFRNCPFDITTSIWR